MNQVAGMFVRALLEVCEQRGVPRDELLRGSTVRIEQLADADALVDFASFCSLGLRAADLTGDPALGLHLAERSSEAGFALLGLLLTHAPNLREAIAICRQFEALFVQGARLNLVEQAGVVRLQVDFIRSDPRFDMMLAELIVAGILRMVRVFAGPNARALSVSFEHHRPDHYREYARIFSGVERFGQRATDISFPAELLDRPHLHSYPALQALLHPHVERALDRLAVTKYSERLEHYFLARSAARIPGIATAARELGLSERSLRRKLREEGVSYRDLVQSALTASARRLLRDPRFTLQQVADQLGFSDVPAFHRAFKRWTGTTPRAFRELRASDSVSKSCESPKIEKPG